MIINKPAGLQVLPGGSFHQRCLITLLQWMHNYGNAPVVFDVVTGMWGVPFLGDGEGVCVYIMGK